VRPPGSGGGKSRASRRVFAPKFHKPKEYGWWLVLGASDGELLALKRITSPAAGPTRLSFAAPEDPGHAELTLWLVSDCIRGLDQRTTVPLEVLEVETAVAKVLPLDGDD